MEVPVFAKLAGSLAVIAVIVVTAALLGFRKGARIDDDSTLTRLLLETEPTARLQASLIAADGRAALARLLDGRLMVARGVGDSLSVRILPASAVRFDVTRTRVRAGFGDLGFPPLDFKFKDKAPPSWILDLAASAGEEM